MDTVRSYLDKLGVDDPGEPSIDGLRRLHRAHVERIPYEVVDIHLRRPQAADGPGSVRRILAGRGGYCIQLNGAFSELLGALGYRVSWHRMGLQANRRSAPVSANAPAPHLSLTVELDGIRWLVDVGLGDGPHDPLPLLRGTHLQGPFSYRLDRSSVHPDGWRFEHDPRGSVAAMDFTTTPATRADVQRWHAFFTTSPDSRLVRTLTVMRREQSGVDALVGCMLRRVDATGKSVREITDRTEWFQAMADVFDLPLRDVDGAARRKLWDRVRANHELWLAKKATETVAAIAA